jgi:TrmH family RNA methyltransferase
MLSNISIILHRPQKLVNIAGAVRAMKNMGFTRLRLVAPAEYDPYDIAGIAHRSDDILANVQILPDLDSALADLTYVVGTTGRRRGDVRPPLTPREAAPMLLGRAQEGALGLLFGPEDNGLINDELDRCHLTVTAPTDPAYPSLNLAQSVLLLCYELRLATPAAIPPRPELKPTTHARLEEFFGALEQALWDVQFFKTEHAESMMRTLRALTHRADPDMRETGLLLAIAREISKNTQRIKAMHAAPPAADDPPR